MREPRAAKRLIKKYHHTDIYIHIHIHTYTHTHTYIHTYTHTRIHTYTPHTHTHTHTHAHTHTHTRTHTHTHTHTHAHTESRPRHVATWMLISIDKHVERRKEQEWIKRGRKEAAQHERPLAAVCHTSICSPRVKCLPAIEALQHRQHCNQQAHRKVSNEDCKTKTLQSPRDDF